MLYYEKKFKERGYDFIVGVDEAGRGPLAGPVVAAAVILGTSRFKNRIDDSKRLTPLQREKAFAEITRTSLFGIGIVSEQVIERLNILNATRIAMENALSELKGKLRAPKDRRIHVLVDGNMKINAPWPYTAIIAGDTKSKSIASASIVAKVARDRIMSIYDKIYPQYGFLQHKGYGTRMHMAALKNFGPCAIHRAGFLKCLDRI